MKKGRLLFIFFAALLIWGCSGDEKQDDYKVIGEMIVARNKARQKTNLSVSEQQQTEYSETETPSKTSEDEKAVMMFEEEVEIISTSTGNVIARATAYLDKGGRIINIRIKKQR